MDVLINLKLVQKQNIEGNKAQLNLNWELTYKTLLSELTMQKP